MNNLGSVLKDVARYDEALIWLRKGAEALNENPAALPMCCSPWWGMS